MAVSTTSTEAELIAEYWNTVFLDTLRDNLTFWKYGLKSPHGRGQGTMCHWLGLYDLTASAALSEGSDPTEHVLSAKDITATVAQYGGSVLVSELLQDTWVQGSYQTLMERLAYNAALTLDTVVRDACFSGGGSAQYGGTATARTNIATGSSFDADISEIREATHSLAALKVKTFPDGFYVGIANQDVIYDLQGDTANWQEFLKHTEPGYRQMQENFTGQRPGGQGIVGSLFGVKFILSQLALLLDASGSASTDVYQSYIFGPEHYGVSQLQDVQTVIKNPHPASDLDLYGSVGWKAAFVSRELNASKLIRLETGASLGD